MVDRNRHPMALVAALAAVLLAAGPAPAQEVKSLRGDLRLEDLNPAPDIAKQQTPREGMFDRAYRQQPPLIPHRVDGYQVTKDYNQCLTCHDWPANIKAGAPKASEAHYADRDGNRLDHVSGQRFFCTQCHVPQDDVQPLVANTFRKSSEPR